MLPLGASLLIKELLRKPLKLSFKGLHRSQRNEELACV
jgi:hypothetical protein